MIAENLKTILASTFTMYLKAHKFHWNIMGPDFAQHHEYLSGLYEELYGSIDTIAETIRTCGEFAPGSLTEFTDLSVVEDSEEVVTNPMEMFNTLIEDNDSIVYILKQAFKVSEEEETFDISDMLATRIAAHKKHGWMLNSFLNKQAD